MSDPVPPPGGNYLPPPAQGQPGFPPPGQAPQGGYPPPGQSGYPPPGQDGYPQQPGQPGFPPPPPGQPGGPEAFGQFPTEKKKRSVRSVLVSILVLVVVVIAGVAIKAGVSRTLNPDNAKQAKVGDCVAAQGKVPTQEGKTTEADAKVVDCTSSEAAYTVVGRVNGETDTNSKSCDKFFTDEKADYFVYSSTSGSGYLLCLQAKKA